MSDLALLGICGKKRHGKDTVAQRLVEHHGFVRVGFADALKELALDLDPIIHGYDDYAVPPMEYGDERLSDVVRERGWERAKEIPEVRRILQALGVGVRDHIGVDTWTGIVQRKILYSQERIVVPDVRFPNEVDVIRSLGGKLIRVVRPDMTSDDEHVSETALDGVKADIVLPNTGTIETLHELTDAAMLVIANDRPQLAHSA